MRRKLEGFEVQGNKYKIVDDVPFGKHKSQPSSEEPYGHHQEQQDSFRDGRRRIDVVLVAADDGNTKLEKVKTEYLQNVLKTGLEIEIEKSVMLINQKLVFIKIHAPDMVLNEYESLLCTKKYFKDYHLRFILPGRSIIGKLWPFTRMRHEREWIALVREGYKTKLFLSNAERSLIVYKILLQLPFGEHRNYFGLKKLLKRRVILDAYALHDGPFFISPDQDVKKINARQLLFYSWVGIWNTIKVHPLDLIREYFGEQVGMYFAFYEFYNHALVFPTLAGLATVIYTVCDSTDNVITDDVCNDQKSTVICQTCSQFEVCPPYSLTDYCYVAYIHKYLDSPVTSDYAIFLVLWALAFAALWRKKESYWIWLWELKRNIMHDTVRTEYLMSHKLKTRSSLMGTRANYDTVTAKYARFTIATLAFFGLVAGLLVMEAHMFRFKYNVDQTLIKDNAVQKNIEQIMLTMIFAISLIIIQILGEFILKIPLSYIIKIENHKTYESYMQSYSFKKFVVSFTLTFAGMFYFAWIKGLFFVFPGPSKDNSFKEKYLSINCGPFTCLNEVFVLLSATIFLRHVLFRIIFYIRGFIFNTTTDFNQGKYITEKTPSWEREYRLVTVTEKTMANKYNFLAMQFALVTLLGTVFPLAPMLVFLVNLCDIRYEARMFLLCSRRPLLLDSSGLGVWTNLMHFLAFASVLTNALTLVRASITVTRTLYISRVGSMEGFLFNNLIHNRINNRYGRGVPYRCWLPGLWTTAPSMKVKVLTYNGTIFRDVDFYSTHLAKIIYFSIFTVAGLTIGIITANGISQNRSVLKIIRIEERLKNIFRRRSCMEHHHIIDQQKENEIIQYSGHK